MNCLTTNCTDCAMGKDQTGLAQPASLRYSYGGCHFKGQTRRSGPYW